MENFDEMMKMWKEMDGKITSLMADNRRMADEIKKNRLKTNQEKLARKYRCFIIMEAVCIPLMFLLFIPNPHVVEQYRWVTLIYFVAFFLLEIGIDAYLLFRLDAVDIYRDSISRITRVAQSNWKIHRIAVLIGIPVAIGAVILFILAMGGRPAELYGVAVGGAIGLGIGLNQFFKFMKNYKALSSESSAVD